MLRSIITTIFILFFSIHSFAQTHLYEIDQPIHEIRDSSQQPFKRSHQFLIKKNNSLNTLKKGEQFNIDLPEGFSVTVNVLSTTSKNRKTSLVGRITTDPNSIVSLTLSPSSIAGSIFAGGQHYQIKNNSLNQPYISKVTLKKGFLPIEDTYNPAVKKSSQPVQVTEPSTDNFIDVVIGYTTEAGANSDIEETITAWVAATNQMLADSCVNFRYRLVGTLATGVTSGTDDAYAIIDDLDDPTGPYAALHTLRENTGADLVHLIVQGATIGLCGLANLGGTGNFWDDNRGWGLSAYGCPTFVLAHEFGHNLSLRHDRYQQDLALDEDAVGGEHYGFVDTTNQFESIMAYQDHCLENGTSCERLNKFSNPRISHNGVDFGLDQFADNADALNRSFPYVANYRQSVTSFSPEINQNCAASGANEDLHCFVATATYGSPLHPKIKHLRSFRDNFLNKFSLGKLFVNTYYKYSPRYARIIGNNSFYKFLSLLFIGSLIFLLQYYWIIFPVALSFLILKKFRFMIVLVFILIRPEVSHSYISIAPFDNGQIATNPSLYLGSSKNLLGLSVENISGKADPTSLTSIKTSATAIDVYGGYYTPTFSFNLRYRPEFDYKTKTTNIPLAEIETSVKSDLILADMSFLAFWGLPLGIRITQQSINDFGGAQTPLLESSLLTANFGSKMQFSSLSMGGGIIYNTQSTTDLGNNDQKLTANWLSLYLALGLSFSGSGGGGFETTSTSNSGGQMEVSYRRDPEVLQIENGSQVAKPETSDIQFVFQYLYPLSTDSVLFSVGYQMLTRSAIENVLPDPSNFDKISVGLGYQETSWSLNSNIYMRSEDTGNKSEDLGIQLSFNYFFSSGAGVSSY